MTDASEMLAALAAPFPPDVVSWRAGSFNKDKTKAKALAYLDARDVMRRLDAVVGAANWQRRYVPMPNATCCCEVSIRINGEWIAKADGAGATDIEGEKGQYSDAFKRAAVNWGVGQYLYDVDAPWVMLNQWKQIDPAELPKLQALLVRNGQPAKSSYAARKDDPDAWKRHVAELQQAGHDGRVSDYVRSVQATTAQWPDKWQERWGGLIEQARDLEPARALA